MSPLVEMAFAAVLAALETDCLEDVLVNEFGEKWGIGRMSYTFASGR